MLAALLVVALSASVAAQSPGRRCQGGYCTETRCKAGAPTQNCHYVTERQCRPVVKEDCQPTTSKQCRKVPYKDCKTTYAEDCRTTVTQNCVQVTKTKRVKVDPGCGDTTEFPCQRKDVAYTEPVCAPKAQRTCRQVPKQDCKDATRDECTTVSDKSCRKRVYADCRDERRYVCNQGQPLQDCREVRFQIECGRDQRWTPSGCERAAQPAQAEPKYSPPPPPTPSTPPPPTPSKSAGPVAPPPSPAPPQQAPPPPPPKKMESYLPTESTSPPISWWRQLDPVVIFVPGSVLTGALVLLLWKRKGGRGSEHLRRAGVVVVGRADAGHQGIEAEERPAAGPIVTLRASRGPFETGIQKG